jgi:hypothetical protein
MKGRKSLKLIIFLLALLGNPLIYAIGYRDLPEWQPSAVIVRIIEAILGLVTIVAAIFLIIGGFKYITASGNPEQIETAKKTILYAVIGLVIILLSYAITRYIAGIFGIAF